MTFRKLAAVTSLLLLSAGTASAQALKLEFANGRVTLVADNVPARTILAEWARLGGTRIVNGERVAGPPITVQLTDVPERQALDIVLRGVAGYMMTAGGTGASRINGIMILPTSTAPRATTTTAGFAPPPPPAVDNDAQDADIDEPVNNAARPVPPPPVRIVGVPGSTAAQPVTTPGLAVQPFAPPPEAVHTTTGPQPAATPVTRPSNPFTTLPGTSRPGEITPPPPQQQNGNRPGGPNTPPNAER